MSLSFRRIAWCLAATVVVLLLPWMAVGEPSGAAPIAPNADPAGPLDRVDVPKVDVDIAPAPLDVPAIDPADMSPPPAGVPGMQGEPLKRLGTETGMGAGTGFGSAMSSSLSISGARSGAEKARLLKLYGGDEKTEAAVAAGLDWLLRHQNADGSWSLSRFNARCKDATCAGPAGNEASAAATALALLPMLGAGHHHLAKGPYQASVQNGLRYLMANQKRDGDLAIGTYQTYSHALATLALCEAAALSGDNAVKARAQLAIAVIEKGQSQQGGWRYLYGTPDGDLSVTAAQIMALRAAKLAGIAVREETLKKTAVYLQACAVKEGEGPIVRYAYVPKGGATPSMTAAGMLIRRTVDPKPDQALLKAEEDRLDELRKTNRTIFDAGGTGPARTNLYAIYYATQVLHRQPDEAWKQWNETIVKPLANQQSKQGCSNGSWDPSGDAWGRQGGRLLTTSLALLALESYYRYPPPAEKKAE